MGKIRKAPEQGSEAPGRNQGRKTKNFHSLQGYVTESTALSLGTLICHLYLITARGCNAGPRKPRQGIQNGRRLKVQYVLE